MDTVLDFDERFKGSAEVYLSVLEGYTLAGVAGIRAIDGRWKAKELTTLPDGGLQFKVYGAKFKRWVQIHPEPDGKHSVWFCTAKNGTGNLLQGYFGVMSGQLTALLDAYISDPGSTVHQE